MLTIICSEALLVDEEPADQVWEAWDADNIRVYLAWWRVANSAIFKSLVPDLEAIMVTKKFLSAASIVFALALLTSTTNAEHTWKNYHWARTANPMPLQVVDSVSDPGWQFELDIALAEWNQSYVLDMSVTSDNDSNRTRKRCKMKAGQMRVCNTAYGFNGWLGRATIGLDSDGHIDQGKAQVNDSYSSYWSDPDEKRHVMC